MNMNIMTFGVDSEIHHLFGFKILFFQVGSASSAGVQLFGPLIQPKHCLIAIQDNACVVTPLHTDAPTFVNNHRIYQPTVLHVRFTVYFLNSLKQFLRVLR